MSNVSISIDTESKEISFTIDGKQISNVESISVYKESYNDEESYQSLCGDSIMSIDVQTRDDETGSFRKTTRYTSYGGVEFKLSNSDGPEVTTEELTKALFKNRL